MLTTPHVNNFCTAWDSEIESLTSVDASLIEPDRKKTRRRHRVTAALAVSFPVKANLHVSSVPLKHGLPSPSFFEWSSFLAHRLVVITDAIVQIKCKKETWRVGSSQPRKENTHLCSRFPFIFPPLWLFLQISKCSEWLLLGVATTNYSVVVSSRCCLMLVLRVRES